MEKYFQLNVIFGNIYIHLFYQKYFIWYVQMLNVCINKIPTVYGELNNYWKTLNNFFNKRNNIL